MRVGGVVVIAHGAGLPRARAPSASCSCLAPGFGSGRRAAARRRSSASAWAPCTGPDLRGAILALTVPLAGGGSGVARGIVLACAYSLGLGLPFLLIAAGYRAVGRASALLRRHHRGIQVVGGALLLVVGLLLVTGRLGELTALAADRLVTGFETVI